MDLGLKSYNQNKTQWFILYDNGYQGPFFHQDIEYLYNSKQIGIKNLIWNDSLNDWFQINNRPEFSHLNFSKFQHNYVQLIDPQILSAIETQKKVIDKIDFELEKYDLKINSEKKIYHPNVKNFKKYFYLFLLVLFFGVSFSIYLKQSNQYKDLIFLSKEDNHLLKLTASSDYVPGNEKTEIVTIPSIEKNEINIYVSTNLPKISEIEIMLESVPNSIIGREQIKEIKKAKVQNKVAQAKFDFYKNGKIIPGKYKVSVSLENKLSAQKTTLLGYKTEKEFQLAINQYRVQINEQAKNEIAELKQISLLVENQNKQIQKNLKGSTLKNWREIQTQLTTMSQFWVLSAESQQIYKDMYASLKTLIEQVSNYEKEKDDVISQKIQTGLDRLKSQLNYLESMQQN